MRIDVNVSLSNWPFRRLRDQETQRLVAKLRQHGVSQAWAGSFDALLHRDLAAVNQRLAVECRQTGGYLIPFGTVHPGQPDWREDLRRCQVEHQMPGIRVFPNYHQYTLDDQVFLELAQRAAEAGLILQIAVTMEDSRTQHPLLQVAPVDVRPLMEILTRFPDLKVILVNAMSTVDLIQCQQLVSAGNVYFEIGMLEGVGGLERVFAGLPVECLLFGSHSPFFCHESASLKVKESSLAATPLQSLLFKNAQRLLQRA